MYGRAPFFLLLWATIPALSRINFPHTREFVSRLYVAPSDFLSILVLGPHHPNDHISNVSNTLLLSRVSWQLWAICSSVWILNKFVKSAKILVRILFGFTLYLQANLMRIVISIVLNFPIDVCGVSLKIFFGVFFNILYNFLHEGIMLYLLDNTWILYVCCYYK